jgi:hypothetical protein
VLHGHGIISRMTTQLYHDDGSMTLVLSDEMATFKREGLEPQYILTSTPEEVEELARIEREYVTPPALRAHELAELFPDAKHFLEQRKKEYTAELEGLLERERDIHSQYTTIKEESTKEFLLWSTEKQRQHILDKRTADANVLMFMGKKGKNKAMEYQAALSKAKSFPIDNLVEVKHGSKALCVWHDETNPSMHYYRKNNTVWCFSCGRGGDAVDVVMAQRNCTMVEAMDFLNNTGA